MSFRIKLIEERGRVKLRDGRTLADPVKLVSAKEWTVFENRPKIDDPNMIIEEIAAEPVKPKRRRRRKAAAEPVAVES